MKAKNIAKRLEARQKDFEKMNPKHQGQFHKPGSRKK